ncbi:MAG: hypothetical protein MUD01_12885 [Chloroflexaceae bacterium]|nr:hypothetical protein [Chloroflexaceae bacterium]
MPSVPLWQKLIVQPITLLLLLFLSLSTLYNVTVPLGEGPDEPGHFAYALFLAREGRFPVQQADPARSDVPGEGHQPPLAYMLLLPAVATLPPTEQRLTLIADPQFVWDGGEGVAAWQRSSREYWPWRGVVLAWHLARGINTLLGALVVLFVYLAMRTWQKEMRDWRLEITSGQSPIVNRQSLPLLAAALVALNPQFLFTSALVTNDMLLAALCGTLFWLCVRGADRRPENGQQRREAETQRRRVQTVGRSNIQNSNFKITNRQSPIANRQSPHVRWALIVGLLFGLALLTKQNALLLGPLLLWGSWRVAGGNWRTAAGVTLGWGLLALLVAGWWYGRNWLLYGDIFGLELFQSKFTTQVFEWWNLAAWQGALLQLFSSFWAYFGWLSLRPPPWVHWCYGLLCGAALLGWLVRLRQLIREEREGREEGHAVPFSFAVRELDERQGRRSTQYAVRNDNTYSQFSILNSQFLPPLLLLAMTLVWVVAFAFTAGLVAWQGRMLFPALPAIALLLAGGLVNLIGDRRPETEAEQHRLEHDALDPGDSGTGHRLPVPGLVPGSGLQSLVLGLLVVLALYLPLAVIAPAYVWPTLRPAEALAELGNPTYGRFAQEWEQGLELRGWRLSDTQNQPLAADALRPGQAISVTLTWHALEVVPLDWTVFVHLVGADEQIVAEHNGWPAAGRMPTTRWTPGDWLRDSHPLALPAGLPPGSYELRVGLFRPEEADWRRQELWREDGSFGGNYVVLGTLTLR